MLNVDEDTSFIYLSGEINISTNGVVVGDIEPVLGCVGYNVRLRDIAGEICAVVLFYELCGRIWQRGARYRSYQYV